MLCEGGVGAPVTLTKSIGNNCLGRHLWRTGGENGLSETDFSINDNLSE